MKQIQMLGFFLLAFIITGCVSNQNRSSSIINLSAQGAGAKYDSAKNIVELTTPLMAKNIDIGFIKIYSEKHIKISGFASKDKLVKLCGNKPSLGLLYLNGKLNIDHNPPRVTEVEKSKHKDDKESNNAGWVNHFVLKGDDALDLMDLLYEYKTVGFDIMSERCKETKHLIPGRIILNFGTHGLKRAMKRLK